MARLKSILALLTEANELEIAIIENLQRENLRPIEEAEGLGALQKRFGYKQAQLTKVVGKPRVAVNESLKLLELPEMILEECRTSDIAPKHHPFQVVRCKTIAIMCYPKTRESPAQDTTIQVASGLALDEMGLALSVSGCALRNRDSCPLGHTGIARLSTGLRGRRSRRKRPS